MTTNQFKLSAVAALLATTTLGGCSSMDSSSKMSADAAAQAAAIQAKEQQIASMRSSISGLERDLATARTAAGQPAPAMSTAGALLPPNAKSGECYARAFVPPTYRNETQTIVKREAGESLEIIPAQYSWATEQVVSKEASERLEVIPATYGWEEERILVKPASTRVEATPPVYKTETEQVMEKPASTMWKKGTGAITKVDDSTGEIMCLVDVPAVYKTVTKRVLVKPAGTRTVEIPAEYKTVRRQVQKTPPTTRAISIPAEYKTVKVRKLAKPEETRRIPIPEQTQTVTKRIQVTEGHVEWRPILCKTNLTTNIGMQIQRALAKAGHNPGPIDGVMGRQTMGAVESYQRAKGLARGGLTMNTLNSLGVKF